MDFNNSRSIFLQIADSLLEKIMSDVYKTGDKIPSVRELAAEMGVNPNTIMRTYMELQNKQIIENKRGIGFFVNNEAKTKIKEWKREDFFQNILPEFLQQLNILEITLEDLKPYFKS